MSREVIDIRTFDREIADRAAEKLEKETVRRPTALIVQSRIGRPSDFRRRARLEPLRIIGENE
jgi:hypothetical protein